MMTTAPDEKVLRELHEQINATVDKYIAELKITRALLRKIANQLEALSEKQHAHDETTR